MHQNVPGRTGDLAARVRPQHSVRDGVTALATQSSLFVDLSLADATKVFSAGREKRLAARETIFVEGDPVDRILLIISGSAKVSQLGEDGSTTIIRLVGPGEVVGALGMLDGDKHFSTAQSLEPCWAIEWEIGTFEALTKRIPVLQRNLARILNGRLEELEQRFREVSTQTVSRRLAVALNRISACVGRRVDGAVEIGLTREELAQITGTTLFTVSRLLSQWEQQGILDAGRGFVAIRDPRALEQLSEGE